MIVKGIYEDGKIILENLPNTPKRAQVLVTFIEEKEVIFPKKGIQIGKLKGLFEISDDFDESLDDLKDYMY